MWAQRGIPGYAIEIRNPFRKTIYSLRNVFLYVNDVLWDDLETLMNKGSMEPGEVVVLYRDSTGGDPDDDSVEAGLVELLPADTPYTSQPIDKDWPTTGGPVMVGLRAKNQEGNVLPWPYMQVPSEDAPDVYVGGPPLDPIDDAGKQDYLQLTSLSNGNGLNVMAIRHEDITVGVEEPSPDANNRNISLDALGEGDKTVKGGPEDVLNPPDQQLLISDRGLITHVGELAQIAFIGPRPPEDTIPAKTIPEMWNGATSVEAFMLDFSALELVDAAPLNPDKDSLAVPHAVMILDHFTTLSPNEDQEIDPHVRATFRGR